MRETRIAFIGGGNMATSLIKGLINNNHQPELIAVSDPERSRLAVLSSLGVSVSEDNAKTIAGAGVVVLAVKPQVLIQVLRGLQTSLSVDQLVISIAAGVNLQTMQSVLKANQPIVRCMPNSPALIGKGMTVLHANTYTTDQQREIADAVLQAAGLTRWVEAEELLDAVTALSGTGPAYFFYLMEAMIKTGVELGLTEELATTLTLQTALGAAELAIVEDSPAELRRAVTSPGGTTEAAMAVFASKQCGAIISEALVAAHIRSQTLAKS